MTASYVLFDPASAELVGANAGHPSPLLLSGEDGDLLEIGGHGPILGRFESAGFEETRHPLSPGDRLILYTDGLVEARDKNNEMYGEDRMRRSLHRDPALALEDMCDRLLADLKDWMGGDSRLALDDDLTLIALEVPERNVDPG